MKAPWPALRSRCRTCTRATQPNRHFAANRVRWYAMKWKNERMGQRTFGLRRADEIFALCQIEFARCKHRDCFDAADSFWDPKIRNTRVAEFSAQLFEVDIDRGQEQNGFAFRFVRHADDDEKTL